MVLLQSLFTYQSGAFQLLALLLVVNVSIFYFFSVIKWYALRAMGVSYSDCLLIYSNRKKSFCLGELLNKYSEYKLMRIDALVRKAKHLVSGFFRLFILTTLSKSPAQSIQVLAINNGFMLALLVLSYRSNAHIGLGGLFYGADSRVRDGKYGRINFFLAQVGALINLFFIILSYVIASKLGFTVAHMFSLVWIVYLPLVIGDAFGEVCGSLWGKQTIKVYGVAEINRKSWLGVFSIFVSSLLSLLVYLSFQNWLQPYWIVLSLVISAVTAIVELVSPRGIDNITIPLANFIIYYTFIYLFFN